MDYYDKLGRTLTEVRVRRGLTQSDLATMTGKSVSTIHRWESGAAEPGAYDLHLLARGLRVPADLLVNPPAAPPSPVELAMRGQGAGGAPGPQRPRLRVSPARVRGRRRPQP